MIRSRSGLVGDYRLIIDQAIRDIEQALGGGSVKDWASYTRETGRVAGLKKALGLFDDTLRLYVDENDME